MSNKGPDFSVLKQRINIEQVCTRYGVSLRKVNQTSLRGPCPLPTHPQDRGDSFSINTEKNVYSCHQSTCVQARGGKKGGDLISFVAVMEGCSLHQAGQKLGEWYGVETTKPEARAPNPKPAPEAEKGTTIRLTESHNLISAPKIEQEVNHPLAFSLKDVAYHPYLEQRGVPKALADSMGIGFFPGKGSMAGRVVIPIHNGKGELVAYAGRTIDGTDPKYKFPPGFHKGQELYNLHRAMTRGDGQVVVCEGFFQCLKLHSLGYAAVALMGSSMSDDQAKLLSGFVCVTVFMDGDEAGKAASAAIVARLVRQQFARVIEVDGKQPDELSTDELKSLLG